MVIKRKSSSDVILGQDGSSASTKRVSLGWEGSSEKYHQQGQDLARKGKYAEAIRLFTDVGYTTRRIKNDDIKRITANLILGFAAEKCQYNKYYGQPVCSLL